VSRVRLVCLGLIRLAASLHEVVESLPKHVDVIEECLSEVQGIFRILSSDRLTGVVGALVA
jgi:hypothetical protein